MCVVHDAPHEVLRRRTQILTTRFDVVGVAVHLDQLRHLDAFDVQELDPSRVLEHGLVVLQVAWFEPRLALEVAHVFNAVVRLLQLGDEFYRIVLWGAFLWRRRRRR